MSLFEFSFTLTSVILGLALANIVGSLHRLALGGRKVRWAPEPVLLTTLVTMIIVYVWLDQWFDRSIAEVTYGRSFLQVLKMMALYFAAASCLPEPEYIPPDGVDLYDYYDRTRALTYGALITGLLLFWLYLAVGGHFDWLDVLFSVVIYPAIYLSLIFVRKRWYNVAVLAGVILYYGSTIVGLTLTQPSA